MERSSSSWKRGNNLRCNKNFLEELEKFEILDFYEETIAKEIFLQMDRGIPSELQT